MAGLSEKIEAIDAATAVQAPPENELDIELEADKLAQRFAATADEVLAAQGQTQSLTLDDARERKKQILDTHSNDPNFFVGSLERLEAFLDNSALFENPEKHKQEIDEAKIEVLLLTSNSPYPEVRAVVDPYDDPDMPCGTIRAWVIGLGFVIIIAFVNQLFTAERFLPDVGVTLFGTRHSLNPGPFNKKEHMVISIMASVGRTLPSSRYIIFTQWLDKYFGRPYAKSFGYQILLALSTDLMGFGLAGLCRRFLVYPSFCLWPKSLVTTALNSSLHNEQNHSVPGPLRSIFSISRFRFFLLAFSAMFIYFWFPDYIFSALSLFNWLAWIAPNNFNLTAITGIKKGLGFNPLPTFDWNIVMHVADPLIVPFNVTINTFFGVLIGGITIIGLYWTNAYHTAYLPINTNSMFNHFATSYNVSQILDDRGLLDESKYQSYSPVYLAASSLTFYFFFFAVYAATVSYAWLYHRQDIAKGFRSLVRSFKRGGMGDFTDVHSRLMAVYSEVPEWWYAILNVVAIVLGVAAVASWPTFTNVGVVFFGIALALVFVIPTGIIEATTGISVEFNVLAEFIGGAWNPGNAIAMNFFKCYGVPPRQTFWAQVVAVVVSAFFCTGVMNFQITHIPGICQSDQKDRFTCPGVNTTYFTAAVLFGSIGARKVFGRGGQYTALLSAFPVGFAISFVVYAVQKRIPRGHWFAKFYLVMFLNGGIHWSPYNIAYMWPAVLPAYISMRYLRSQYLAFWSKYNYVLSAAFSTAIAVAGVVIFLAVSYNGFDVKWWGNDAESGCEEGEYFGPRIGTFA
ncbi:OPT oligopeptide transporter protein-domain-containing protein [Aspergillus tetrazonus]